MEIKKCTNADCTHTGNEDVCTICGNQMKKAFDQFGSKPNYSTRDQTNEEHNVN